MSRRFQKILVSNRAVIIQFFVRFVIAPDILGSWNSLKSMHTTGHRRTIS